MDVLAPHFSTRRHPRAPTSIQRLGSPWAAIVGRSTALRANRHDWHSVFWKPAIWTKWPILEEKIGNIGQEYGLWAISQKSSI